MLYCAHLYMGLLQRLRRFHHVGCVKPHAYLCGRFYWYQLWHEHRWSNWSHSLFALFLLMGAVSGIVWQTKLEPAVSHAGDTGRLPTGPGLAWPEEWASLDSGTLPAWQARQRHDGSGEVVIAFVAGGALGTFQRLSDFSYSLDGGISWFRTARGDGAAALAFDWQGSNGNGYPAGELGWFVFYAKEEIKTQNVSTDNFRIKFVVRSSDGARFLVTSEAITLDTTAPVWSGVLALSEIAGGVRVSWPPVLEDHFVSYTVWYGDDPGILYRRAGSSKRQGPSQDLRLFDRLSAETDISKEALGGRALFLLEARDFFGNVSSTSSVRFGTVKEQGLNLANLNSVVASQAPELGPLPPDIPLNRVTRALSSSELQWCFSDRWPQYTDHYLLHNRSDQKLTAVALLNSDGVVCVPEKNLRPNTSYEGRHVHAVNLKRLESSALPMPGLVTQAESPELKTFTSLPPLAASLTVDAKNNPVNTEYAFIITSTQFDPHTTFYLGINNNITTMPTWALLQDWYQDRSDKTIVVQNLQPNVRYGVSVRARSSIKVETAPSTPLSLETSVDLSRLYILPPTTLKGSGACPAGARWCDPKAK